MPQPPKKLPPFIPVVCLTYKTATGQSVPVPIEPRYINSGDEGPNTQVIFLINDDISYSYSCLLSELSDGEGNSFTYEQMVQCLPEQNRPRPKAE